MSSTETKAHETLLCAGGRDVTVAQDPGFDEVRRYEPFDGDYEARRTAWVEGRLDERHEGWETPDVTAQRFDSAVAARAASGAPLVIASHGMAMTAWLVHSRHVIAPDHAARFWRALAFLDVIEVDD